MDSTKKCRFTGDELAVLDNYRDSWKNATRPKRTEIAGKAWEEIKQLNNKFVNDEPGKKLKKKGIQAWFHKYGRKRESKEKFKFSKRWNRRLVIAKEKPEALKTEIGKLTDAPEGSTTYLSHYQKGLTNLIKALKPGEILKAKETAALWNGTGPPPDIQAKLARTKGTKYIKEFCIEMKKTCGMTCLVLETHLNEEGHPVVTYQEYGGELGSKSFFEEFPEWKQEPIMDNFLAYSESLAEEKAEAMPVKSITRQPLLDLEVAKDGQYLLPKNKPTALAEKKKLVRSIIGLTYRSVCGNPKARPPWKEINANPDHFIEPEYLPPDFIMQEPTKLVEAQLDQLLEFWYQRQLARKVVLSIKGYKSRAGEILPPVKKTSKPVKKQLKKGKGKSRKPAQEVETDSEGESFNFSEAELASDSDPDADSRSAVSVEQEHRGLESTSRKSVKSPQTLLGTQGMEMVLEIPQASRPTANLINVGKSSEAVLTTPDKPEQNAEAVSPKKASRNVHNSPIATTGAIPKATVGNSKAGKDNPINKTLPENRIPPVGNRNRPEGRVNGRGKVPPIEPPSEVELIAPRTTRSQKRKETEILNTQAKKKTRSGRK